MEAIINKVQLCGTLAGSPKFSHLNRDEEYYIFPLDIERLSGAVDTVNIIARRSLLEKVEIGQRARIAIGGELRSYNNKSGIGRKLVISVLAKEMELSDEEDENVVRLSGVICKSPNLRRTPMGREICDIMLAVNRKYGRSDYLPCIAWGQTAELAASFDVGDAIELEGRIQSRKYIKVEDGENVEKTAYEVSIVSMEI